VLTTLASYATITADLPRSLGVTAAKPQVARETEYYLAHIEDVKTIDDFLGDDRVFAYAMKAFGLEDMAYAKAFMRKVLEGGIDKRDSFANSLADQRYPEFVATFNFVRYEKTTTIFDRTRQGTVDRYVRQTLEEDAGQENEGVRLALYFERRASGLVSAYGILADAALLKVAQTVLGVPASASALDIDKQAQIFSAKLDVEDLKDPEKLARFLDRFATIWEMDHPSSAPASPALLFSQPLELGMGADLLASLQNLKLGGR
jgi:hypothetical protein